MSNMRTLKTINKERKIDSNLLREYLLKKDVYPDADDSLLEHFTYLHRSIYNFYLLTQEIEDEEDYRTLYLNEIRSDLLESLQLSLIGFKKPIYLYLRCIIENLLKHIYFYDHKIEFNRTELDPSYHVTTRELFDYIKIHPILKEIKETPPVLQLENYYHIFSRYIHSQSSVHMSLSKSIEDIDFDLTFFKKFVDDTCNIVKSMLFILLIFYQKEKNIDNLVKTSIVSYLPKEIIPYL